jgi:hypothetical protein
MIIHDKPLTDIKDDKFGREPVVELIVSSINQVVSTDHPCLVYGIYGKWGEGKTSLMNFVKERLKSQGKGDGMNLVEFNPWLVNNDEALLKEFFKTIMVDVDEEARKIFKKYGSLAIFASKTILNAFIPGAGNAAAEVIQGAKDAFIDAEDTLFELKKKASEAIVKSKRHLIVLIDDVDRLDKEELHAVLRLIRQVADFKNCIYIVAMDVDMVAKSIGDYHGNGSQLDGRKFLDKIVQIPITLPQMPQSDMIRLVNEELVHVLHDFVAEEEIEDIAKAVEPFIATYREIKRFCNQLSFVLPHLKNEVNVKDLCIVEAIKMVNAESYHKIHECRSQLMHESSGFGHLIDKEKDHEEVQKRYDEAKEYIEQGLEGAIKDVVDNAIDILFSSISFDIQEDIDQKRLQTDVYFQKYFVHTVPSELIPDRELDAFKVKYRDIKIADLAHQFDTWIDRYSASELKRAILYTIRNNANGDDQCHAASIMAQAISVCKLAKGLPPHVYVDPEVIPAFVSNQIIYRYMFVQDEMKAAMNVWDSCLLDETLSFIFTNSELNYCLNLLCSSESIFRNGTYNGNNVLPILIKRFEELGVEAQFKYSKFLLYTVLTYWKRTDEQSFNAYAQNLFVNPEVSCSMVFDKFIQEGQEELQDVANFVGLFKTQIPQINERLEKESEEVKNRNSVKKYAWNYKPMLEH